MRWLRGVVLAMVLGGACGSTGDPTSSVAPTAPSTTPQATARSTVPASTTVQTTSSTVEETSPMSGGDVETELGPNGLLGRGVLVHRGDRAWLVSATSTVEYVFAGAAARVFPDGRGGVVFQLTRELGESVGAGDTTIGWWKDPRSEHRELVVDDLEAGGFELHGVVDLGDGPEAVFTEVVRAGPERSTDTLMRVHLETGVTTRLDRIGGWEWGFYDANVNGAAAEVVGRVETDAGAGVVGYDLLGGGVSLGGLDGGCFDVRTPECAEAATGDEDRVVLLVPDLDESGQYLSSYAIVILDRETGAETRRVPLRRPDQSWYPAGLHLIDDLVVINTREWQGPALAAVLVDMATGEVTRHPDAGWLHPLP